MLIFAEVLLGILILAGLIFFNIPLFISSIFFALFLLSLTALHSLTLGLTLIWIFTLSCIFLLNIPFLRRHFLTKKIFLMVKNKLPKISKTEQAVLQAGDVWWEKELFTGRPHWKKFLQLPVSQLSKEEGAFLNHQVEILCGMLKDWDIVNQADLSPETWAYIRQERFLGLVIPKEYGGHGFSASAHSTIIMKIASRSYSAAVNLMVPNSVGLAEFILYYGTKEQKAFYLPRFVKGEEIPCFALTSPTAGSDAGSMTDEGILTYGVFQGERTLGIRLNWDKRYITLAPVATMIGLAFKLYDPEQLLGKEFDLGITLAMIPRDTEGVEIGDRHSPLMMGFLNGPIRGKNVFIPLNYIIGGQDAIGKGWSMMMECLSVGRGISLPALSTATAKLSYRMTSAYAKIREQFNTAIGQFEGIKEALARIGAFTYLCESTRRLTAFAIDQGVKPSIATAITKYHLTEMSRKIVNDAMDVHGGKTIQLGPHNYLGLFYIAQPISITVEGANILTRNLIIFGQGALRCHPYIQQEVLALQDEDHDRALKKFDHLFFKHTGFILSNIFRCFVYGLTNARWIRVPVQADTAKYYRQLTRMSVALSVVTDLSMAVMGGELKQRERLSARLGDVLSYLYLASAALKYYEDHDQPSSDIPYIEWIQNYCLYQIMNAFHHFFVNFPKPRLARSIKNLIFPWGCHYHLPLDHEDHQVAEAMMQENVLRKRLTEYIFLGNAHDICQKMDQAFEYQLRMEPVYKKFKIAIKEGRIEGHTYIEQVLAAKSANILSDQDVKDLLELDKLRHAVLNVDEFKMSPVEINAIEST